MLIHSRRAPSKEIRRRSRDGCIHCKQKKKKCNEKRPQCDRCTEGGVQCEYELAKSRKRRQISFERSMPPDNSDNPSYTEQWPGGYGQEDAHTNDPHNWNITSTYQHPDSQVSPFDWDPSYENSDDVEEIIRTTPLARRESSGILEVSRSQYADFPIAAPSTVASPLVGINSPVFIEFTDRKSRRALMDHFCNVLSHLIVFKEDAGNPFRQLILPLSHASSPVMNAIFALSSAHLAGRRIQNEEDSSTFHNRALQGLAQLIKQNDQAKREEVLGAIILLVYYEVLVQRGNSNIVNDHLKGVRTIMASGQQTSTPTSLFLERAFQFYDVIAALSLGTVPNSSTRPTTTPFQFPGTSSDPMAGSPFNSVDTLLGLFSDLWPIIHRLAHLLSYKTALEDAREAGESSKAVILRTELEYTSKAIELALTNWRPPLNTGLQPQARDNDPLQSTAQDPVAESRMQAVLNNAEAYRHSAFVYLYRTIYSWPRSHSQVQEHTHLSLLACSNVVESAERCYDGPMPALLWPLFVASCEATGDEDRDLARNGFVRTERRQGMNNISKAWEVVQEVWRKADSGDSEVDWREICREWDLSIVFG